MTVTDNNDFLATIHSVARDTEAAFEAAYQYLLQEHGREDERSQRWLELYHQVAAAIEVRDSVALRSLVLEIMEFSQLHLPAELRGTLTK